MITLVIISALIGFASTKPCGKQADFKKTSLQINLKKRKENLTILNFLKLH